MAKNNSGDELEVLGYFIGFWVFLFSKKFRDIWINEFKKENLFGKFFDIIEAISSIVFGVIIPIVAINYLWLT